MSGNTQKEDIRAPLLHPIDEDASATAQETLRVTFSDLIGECKSQASRAWPLVLNFVALYSLSVIGLIFVGRLGSQSLAAAVLGNSLVTISARSLLLGMCGALDTLASQAHGAQNPEAIGRWFKKTVVFLWLHCIPLSCILLAIPHFMTMASGTSNGEGDDSHDPSDDFKLRQLASQYIMMLLPTVWLDTVTRPLNSVLIAQGITRPQMFITFLLIPLHIATNYVTIYVLKFEFLGAAISFVMSQVYTIIFTVTYILCAGLGSRVWGKWSTGWGEGWGELARLAYPAGVMKCAESWAFSLLTTASSLLPDASVAVAAMGIAFSTYGILFMVFSAFSMVTCAAVGKALGAGLPQSAKKSAMASSIVAPTLWVACCIVLLEPHSARWLFNVFTTDPNPELMQHVIRLYAVVSILVGCDGAQIIMSGVIQGLGKQRYGVVVNIVSFYVIGIPTALTLSFYYKLGVEGMYLGMILGPATQLVCYAFIVARTRWHDEARFASQRAHAGHGVDTETAAHV